MRPDACEIFADRLVEYADGELPEAEARAVREHVESCPGCRATVDALHTSLGLAKAIWTDREARPAARRSIRHWSLRWVGLAAAGVLLAAGLHFFWSHAVRLPVVGIEITEMTPEQAEMVAARAGVSAQMLGAAEYLAENGGAELARERLLYLVEAYPETDAAAVARSRLTSERNVR